MRAHLKLVMQVLQQQEARKAELTKSKAEREGEQAGGQSTSSLGADAKAGVLMGDQTEKEQQGPVQHGHKRKRNHSAGGGTQQEGARKTKVLALLHYVEFHSPKYRVFYNRKGSTEMV